MIKKLDLIVVLLLVAMLIYACAKATSDVTPPEISSHSPISDATGVATTAAVSVIFNESMSSSSITTSTFTLAKGSTSVAGEVAYTDSSKTATFTPTTSLATNTAYTATLTTGIQDAAGNTLANATSWSFTTTTEAVVPGVSGPFTLASTAFPSGGIIPNKYAKNGDDPYNIPDALNKSIPLTWSNAPTNAQYFALSMVDTSNSNSAHWLIVNIPSTTTSLAEGASPLSVGTEIANNYQTSGRYEGPWPPKGSVHTYSFAIYALNGRVDTSSMIDKASFDRGIASKTIVSKEITGTFSW